MKVYIATLSGYEHTNLCKAFATKAQDKAWVNACNEYDLNEKRPRYSDEVSYADFYKTTKRIERWEKKHPAGEHNHDSWYGYQELEVINP